jgi:ElaB/YqjD/DUF883 family membrane-anchored ribosome-binding protein
MERNDSNDLGTGLGLGDGAGNANEFSGSGTSPQDTNFDFSGSAGTTEQQSIRDRAKNTFGTASEKLGDFGSGIREKAGGAKNRIAGALEAGADRLRSSQGSGAQLAGASPDGSLTIEGDGRAAQVTNKVAGGMQATADWLRDADIDGLKSGIERQVKEHPGRTLLIAAGLGYLIGKAIRK